MKAKFYYLAGTKVNHQYTCKPLWFIFRTYTNGTIIRLWRLQVVLYKPY